MSTTRQRGRAKYRLTVKLDYEWDADLISWLKGQAPGGRSGLIREALRIGLRQPGRWEPVDIDEMRRVVAEELERVLSGSRLQAVTTEAALPDNQVEARYGDKLNRMLGGFANNRDESA